MQTSVFGCDDRRMPEEDPPSISIVLSPAQVDQVLRAASRSRVPSLSSVIADSLRAPLHATVQADGERARERSAGEDGPAAPEAHLTGEPTDPRMSRSLLRGLAILTCFRADGATRGVVELAREIGISPSSAHRYVLTLVELGLLDRCPQTRRYRLAGSQRWPPA